MRAVNWIGTSIGLAAVLAWPVGCGKDDQQGGAHHEGGHGAAVEVKTDFDDYSAAMAAIEQHRERLAHTIEKNELAKVHAAAKPIQQIAETLNQLAMKEGSGVPRDGLKEVNLTAQKLAKLWAKIDKAGDSGNLAGTKKVYEEMVSFIKVLKHHARPVEKKHQEEAGEKPHDEGHHEKAGEKHQGHQQAVFYACPMKCEGDKTYKQAGRCPVCRMKLKGEGHHKTPEKKHHGEHHHD